MSQNEKRRQKALLKKKRKDKERKRRISPSSGFDSFTYKMNLIKKAKAFPIYECFINDNWKDSGLARLYHFRTPEVG